MSTIWMDPVEMQAGADVLSEQGRVIQEAVAGTTTACTCEAPRSLIGWLDAELVAITRDALIGALGYVVEALDLVVRAEQIKADQSLAAAQPGLLPAGTDLTSAIVGGTVVGGFGASSTFDGFLLGETTVGGSAIAPTVWSSAPAYGTGPTWNPLFTGVGGPSAIDVMFNSGDAISTILSPPGLSFNDGQWVDGAGRRSSSLASAYEDPVTGKLDFG